MSKMLRKDYHNKGNCNYGCCASDTRSRKQQRRSARRREKQDWKA